MSRRTFQPFLAGALLSLSLALSPAATAATPQEPPASPPAGATATPETVRLATFLDDRPTVADPTAHYTLYLPATYDPEGRQPVLLIFDPRGRARPAAELFREAADRYGWILVSSNDTRSDGSWEPNQKALAALWPEIHRLAIDPRRIYATGFSGGAIVAWMLGYRTGELAGVIGVGGRLDPSLPTDNLPFVLWGAAGSWDFNYDEMWRVDELFARQGVPHWLEIFDGPHSWFPAALATRAVAWMELTAMRQGTAPRDEAFIEEEWRRLTAQAAESEAAGEILAAYERYRRIVDAFAGVRDTSAAGGEADRLAQDPRLARQRHERRRWDAADDRYARQKLPLLRQAGDREARVSAEELRRLLEIRSLQAAAEGDGYEAVTARRRLHRVYTQASFYMPRRWFEQGDYRAARTVLKLALEIHDDRPQVWYGLACAAARLGRRKEALAALESAVDRGFGDAAQLRHDDDLSSLRDQQEFRRLVERLESAAGD